MNRRNHYLVISLMVIFTMVASLLGGCTKEGPDGRPGLDGADGKDGAETCSSCHNFSEFLLARIQQYHQSLHAKGTTAQYNGENCSYCHTSMGFRNLLETGTTSLVSSPTPVNCRTCHPIHESYTASDFALRTKSAISLAVGNGTYDYGNSNICAQCHQARAVTPYPVAGGADLTVTNPNYGPHFGPQANMLAGKGPFEIPGPQPYISSIHSYSVSSGCITCHMSPAVGTLAGGHQMNIKYKNANGVVQYNLNGCTDCHGNATNLGMLLSQNRIEIQGLIAQLKDELEAKGLLNASGQVPVPKTMTQTELAAIMNYKFVVGDQSYGAHNYLYTKAVLINAIAALN